MAVRAADVVPYRFGPSVHLRVTGNRAAVTHFASEYGASPAPRDASSDVEVSVTFGAPSRSPRDHVITGGHKSVRWRVALGSPDARPLRAAITLRGGPASFGLSLVQGYFVEPLVALACAGCGVVALPSAGIEEKGHALVLMGRSGSGKSSVSARAIAAGRRVLGDDQVLVETSGRCWAYPRRMRLYPDIRETAPETYARLPRGIRARLDVRRFVRRATRGYVAPSLPVGSSAVGQNSLPNATPLGRLVLIERGPSDVLTDDPLDAGRAVSEALALLEDQRARLRAGADASWTAALDQASRREESHLQAALSGSDLRRLRVPASWNAPRAIQGLAERLGVEHIG